MNALGGLVLTGGLAAFLAAINDLKMFSISSGVCFSTASASFVPSQSGINVRGVVSFVPFGACI